MSPRKSRNNRGAVHRRRYSPAAGPEGRRTESGREGPPRLSSVCRAEVAKKEKKKNGRELLGRRNPENKGREIFAKERRAGPEMRNEGPDKGE